MREISIGMFLQIQSDISSNETKKKVALLMKSVQIICFLKNFFKKRE